MVNVVSPKEQVNGGLNPFFCQRYSVDENKATWELDEGGAGGEEGGEEGGGDSQHTGHTSKLGTSGQGKKKSRQEGKGRYF